ncbi:hypothetical protein P308_27695 [Pseudomonas piscis]|nr:hypothetical protein P308_27695 [Pseudomonas piscis]
MVGFDANASKAGQFIVGAGEFATQYGRGRSEGHVRRRAMRRTCREEPQRVL